VETPAGVGSSGLYPSGHAPCSSAAETARSVASPPWRLSAAPALSLLGVPGSEGEGRGLEEGGRAWLLPASSSPVPPSCRPDADRAEICAVSLLLLCRPLPQLLLGRALELLDPPPEGD